MTEAEARYRYAVYAWKLRRGLYMSDRQQRRCEAIALAIDMAVAERIHGRGTPTATRLAAVDLALKEGIAW